MLCSIKVIIMGQTSSEIFEKCINLSNARVDKFKNSDFQGVINDANKILELYNYDPHHLDDLNNNNTYYVFCVAYEMLGEAKYDLKDYTGAIEAYEEHIRLNPRAYSNLRMWENIGRAKIKLKDYQGALTYINYSIDRNPDKPYGFGLYYRGVIKVFTNDLNGAISDFTYEIDKMEKTDCHYDERYFLARAYTKNLLGDKIGACEDIETVMKLFLGCYNRKDWCVYLTDFPNYDDLLDEICNSEFTYRELVEANTFEKINDLIKQHNDKTQASNNPTPTPTNSPAADRFYNTKNNNETNVTNSSNTPVSSLTDDDFIWKHSKGSFEIKGKEGDKNIWQEDGGKYIYVEQEFKNDGTMDGSGWFLKRKNENVYIKLTMEKCYYRENNNQNWIILYNGGFYSKTLARYLVADDFNKGAQSTNSNTSKATANKSVSNYKFTPPPALKFNYIDNRKMCCCCNERYAQYKTKDKSKLETQEKIFYCAEKLALFHQENGNALLSPTRNQEQIDLDLTNLEDELLKIYPDYGLEIGFGCTMWYNLVSSGFTMKLCSTERQIDLYENIGNHCSQKCKNICGSCK